MHLHTEDVWWTVYEGYTSVELNGANHTLRTKPRISSSDALSPMASSP